MMCIRMSAQTALYIMTHFFFLQLIDKDKHNKLTSMHVVCGYATWGIQQICMSYRLD